MRAVASAPGWLDDALRRVARARVLVFGDFALDGYWELDAQPGPRSLETGRRVRRVRSQRWTPGGAGNVAANLRALGAAEVRALGVLGDDPFGRELSARLASAGVDVSDLLRGPPGWQTPVYVKPMRAGVEQSRYDLGAFAALDEGTAARLAERLDASVPGCDAVVVNQQIDPGVQTEAMLALVRRSIARHAGTCFVVDARDRRGRLPGAVWKIDGGDGADPALPAQAARLAALARKPVFVTRGERGLLVADGDDVCELAGIAVDGPVDPVGAGDTVTAAIAAVLGSGGSPLLAARLANLAAAVTVGKVGTTGTASPAEIHALAERSALR